MKTRTSKILLAICIILAIANVFLAVSMSCGKFVPNRDKFELNYEKYGPFYGRDEVAIIGDGMYGVDYFGNAYHLHSKYAKHFILSEGLEYMLENSNLYFYSKEGQISCYKT